MQFEDVVGLLADEISRGLDQGLPDVMIARRAADKLRDEGALAGAGLTAGDPPARVYVTTGPTVTMWTGYGPPADGAGVPR
jgi:hypothetical protein